MMARWKTGGRSPTGGAARAEAVLRPVRASAAGSLARSGRLQAAPESDWQVIATGLRVRGRLRLWSEVVSLQVDLQRAGPARDALPGRIGLRDGTALRLVGPRARWLALLAHTSPALTPASRGAPLSAAAARSFIPTVPAGAPDRSAEGSPGFLRRLWYRASGAIGAGVALALMTAAMLLFPTRVLVEGRVWFADFVWVVPVVLSLEIGRAARLRMRRGAR